MVVQGETPLCISFHKRFLMMLHLQGRILDPLEEDDISGGKGGRHSTVKKLGSDGAVVRSTLVIKDVTEEDFGAYGCKVANAFGSTSAVILLRKQSKSTQQSNNQQATIHVTSM